MTLLPIAGQGQQESQPALSVKGVWKIFGCTPETFQTMTSEERLPEAMIAQSMVPAVRDANFEVEKGEVFVIMGLSGSGKSTLLRCMTRLIESTSGNVCLVGQNLTKADEKSLIVIRRRHIGYGFSEFCATAEPNRPGNVAFPLEIQGCSHDEIQARANELIELVGLDGREGRYPSELSGGQQQRIGIARSLATNPDFWFLDEPFSALDPLIRADLQDEVLRLQKTLSKTVIFVTHDLDEAIRVADRIAIMENGNIVQIGTPEQLVTQPETNYVRRFVAKIPPARVVVVGSIMEPPDCETIGPNPVRVESTVEEIAPLLLTPGPNLTVIDHEDTIVGVLKKEQALRILTRIDN